MTRLLITFLLLTFSFYSNGQGVWTWVSGSPFNPWPTGTGSPGIYNATNEPGDQYAGACWTDTVFWRFGGSGDDLWKYNPNLEQWAFVKGSVAGTPPVYGTQGIGNAANTPGNTGFGHPHWMGANGNLWVFGNNGSSDMWQFDVSSGNWIWMSGNMGGVPPSYGTQGTFAAANTPGNVNEVDCKWVDTNGDLWLYNDIDGVLWKYDIVLNQWAWMKGVPGGTPVYGTIGTYGAANQPGVVVSCPNTGNTWCYWQYNGEFWIFLNRSFTETEIWKYSPTLNQWACIRTDNAPTGPVYGTQCVESPSNKPEPREETRARWVDDCGNMWFFGGMDYCGGTTYNEFWRYNVATNNWTWLGGGTIPGNTGVMGVPATSNWPYATCGAFSWINEQGFWMNAGGSGTSDPKHLMWLYEPDTVIADFDFVVDTSCTNPGLTDFTDLSSTGCNHIKNYVWDFGDPGSGSSNYDSSANPSHTYLLPGTYTVTLIVTNCTFDSDTIQKSVIVPSCGINVVVNSDTICEGNCAALLATVYGGDPPYQFIWDNGITDTTAGPVQVCPTATTTYTVIATDSNGLSDTATGIIQVMPIPIVDLGPDTLICNGNLLLDAGNTGNIFTWQNGSHNQTYTVTSSGLYWVTVGSGPCSVSDSIHITVAGNAIAFSDTIVCAGDSLLLTAPDSALWNTGQHGTITVTTAGTYSVVYNDSAGCAFTDTVTVLFDSVQADFVVSDTAGCLPLPIQFTDISVSGISPITSHYWNFGDGTSTAQISPLHHYNLPGLFSVTLSITNANNCSDSSSYPALIEAYPLPQADFKVTPDEPESLDEPLQFTDLSTGATGWFWEFGDGTTSNLQNPIHSYSTYGDYTVTLTVTNLYGCTASVSYTLHLDAVFSLYVPNAFSPNGDGINDQFFAVGEGIDNFELMIFDRWGELIFESNNIDKAWTGYYRGHPVKSDIYVWKIKATSTENTFTQLTGHVTVIR